MHVFPESDGRLTGRFLYTEANLCLCISEGCVPVHGFQQPAQQADRQGPVQQ